MKKQLAILAALAISGTAFAGGYGQQTPPQNQPTDPACNVCSHDVVIKANQNQVTKLFWSSSTATANGASSYAANNMSSNTSGVLINASSDQLTDLSGTVVLAEANGANSSAQNNLASNIGSVGVGASQYQAVIAGGSFIKAVANGANSRAIQNMSSNNGCQSCQ